MAGHPQADVIDRFWAERFGCPVEILREPGLHIIADAHIDPSRLIVLELEQATLVRSSDEHAPRLTDWLDLRSKETSRTAADLAGAFSDRECQISPSEKVLYLNPEEFRPFSKPGVRQLTEKDSADLTAMHRGCTLEEQRAGEVSIDHPAIFGAYVEGQLVAAASFIDEGRISDVGVLVHRNFRQQGFGRAVTSALAEWGLEHDRIVQYWRLCENTRSARIASALGFAEYGCYRTLHLNLFPFT